MATKKKTKNQEVKFLLKVVRNSFILAGLYFVSVWATGSLTYQLIKPIILFFITYILTELSIHYKLLPSKIPISKKSQTLIFS